MDQDKYNVRNIEQILTLNYYYLTTKNYYKLIRNCFWPKEKFMSLFPYYRKKINII